MNISETKIRNASQRRDNGAYSLVELLGSLTVISIIGGILARSVLVGLDRERIEDETIALEVISSGLIEYISENQAIPGTNSWANAAAVQLGEALVEIESNEQSNPRQLLVDPNFWSDGDDTLPVAQTVAGFSAPSSPRLILLSSLGAALPNESIEFDEVWNAETAGVISTNAPWDTWSGDWSDLIVQRIDLSGMFHHVLLENASNDADAGYRVNGEGAADGGPEPVLGGLMDTYLLHGTALDLLVDQDSVALSLIDRDQSFHFLRGAWRRSIEETPGDSNAAILSIGDDLKTWVQTNAVEFVDIWVDRRQDRFDFLIAQVDCEAEFNPGEDPESETDNDTETGDSDDGDSDDDDSENDDSENDDSGNDDSGNDDSGNDDSDNDDSDNDDGDSGGKSNNGHGNNIDGVDVSNPGRGKGGPNGEVDPSGEIDDEKHTGNGGG